MSLMSALKQFSRDMRRRADADRTAILALQRKVTALESLIGSGMSHGRAFFSQVELLFVRVTAVVGSPSAGIYTVVPLEFNGTNWVDDSEDATPFNVMAGPGAVPFVGCRCHVMLVAVIAGVGHWITVSGECNGFFAKLTSTVDSNHTYTWTQIDNAPGTTALTNATGSPQLARCKDLSSLAYDVNITSRTTLPTNTEVFLRRNYSAGQFQFVFGPEPQSEAC